MGEHVVAEDGTISEGERLIAEIEGKEIAIFNLDGEYKAYLNWCMHQCGPCAEGRLTGTKDATFDPETLEYEVEWVKHGEILACPWHGWEYDIGSGQCLSKEDAFLPEFPVSVENGEVVVSTS